MVVLVLVVVVVVVDTYILLELRHVVDGTDGGCREQRAAGKRDLGCS